jgi:DNA repair exonuclease SbcCD ATPase subunit
MPGGMETTITKPAPRAADRLNQSVAALTSLLEQVTNDVQALDSEYQLQLIDTVQQTEASLERRGAERLKLAVEEAKENVRALVTGELQSQYNREKAAALENSKAALESSRQEWSAERDQLNQEIERLKQTIGERDTERARLVADCDRLGQLLEQSKSENQQAVVESDEAAAIALERQVATATSRLRAELTAKFEKETAKFESEKARLVAERNRAQQRLAEAAADYEQQMAAELDGLRSQLEKTAKEAAAVQVHTPAASADSESIRTEASRIEGLIKEISKVVEDPETELSVVIRKNVERAELESYLRGLRFKAPNT